MLVALAVLLGFSSTPAGAVAFTVAAESPAAAVQPPQLAVPIDGTVLDCVAIGVSRVGVGIQIYNQLKPAPAPSGPSEQPNVGDPDECPTMAPRAGGYPSTPVEADVLDTQVLPKRAPVAGAPTS